MNPSKRQTPTRKKAAIIKAAAGGHKTAIAQAAGINRKTLYRWLEADLDFQMDFDDAWRQGAKKRTYNTWLNHPFRGLRPPSGKGTRMRPRFSF